MTLKTTEEAGGAAETGKLVPMHRRTGTFCTRRVWETNWINRQVHTLLLRKRKLKTELEDPELVPCPPEFRSP